MAQMRRSVTITGALAFAAAILAARAHAGMLTVAQDGVDGPTCGGKKDPCRSIGRAITNAGAGDKIVVGPGHYGDLDGDGTLGEPGEEKLFPIGSCAGLQLVAIVCIDKPVQVLSRDGFGSTVIDARAVSQDDTVVLSAPGAALGAAKKGFTVVPNPTIGSAAVILGSGTSFVGNHVVGKSVNLLGTGHVVKGNRLVGGLVSASGSAHQIVGNEIIGSGSSGMSLFKCSGCRIAGNLVTRAKLNGIDLYDESGGMVVEGNVVSANDGNGILANRLNDIGTSNVILRGNVVSRNIGAGFRLDGTNLTLTGNVVLGNGFAGVQIDALSDPPVLVKNDFVGNGGPDGGRCGVFNFGAQPVAAPDSYWGAPTGPGPRPADAACSDSAAAVVTEPFATKPHKVKPKLPRIE